MNKKIVILFFLMLFEISHHQYLLSLQQPESLVCQSLKTLVDQILITGDRSKLEKITDNNIKMVGSYLIQARNNVNLALLILLLDPYIPRSYEKSLIELLQYCGADFHRIKNLADEIKFHGFEHAIKLMIRRDDINNLELILLLKNQSVQDFLKNYGYELLLDAVKTKQYEMAELLLQAGAGSYDNTPQKKYTFFVLDNLIERIILEHSANDRKRALNLLKKLFEKGAIVPDLLRDTYRAAAIAIESGLRINETIQNFKNIVKSFIDYGGDINQLNKSQTSNTCRTALDYVDRVNHKEIYEFLRSVGAKHAKEMSRESQARCEIS